MPFCVKVVLCCNIYIYTNGTGTGTIEFKVFTVMWMQLVIFWVAATCSILLTYWKNIVCPYPALKMETLSSSRMLVHRTLHRAASQRTTIHTGTHMWQWEETIPIKCFDKKLTYIIMQRQIKCLLMFQAPLSTRF